MRVCLVYDCLFPWTYGGAERWYRSLAERLAARGPRRHVPHAAAVGTRRSAADRGRSRGRRVGPRRALRRRREPPHRPAAALRPRRARPPAAPRRGLRRRAHGVVPVLLAAGRRAWRGGGTATAWWSTGTRCGRASTGSPTSGAPAGRIGYEVQLACVRIPQRAFCFSRLHRDRLLAEGARRAPELLEGAYAGDLTPPEPNDAEPLVVFAGRHIREKRAPGRAAGGGRRRGSASARAGRDACSATARSATAVRGRDRAWPAPRASSARRGSSTTTCSTTRCAPRCAWCCRRAARATGWWSSRPPRRARRRSWWRGADNAAVELVEDGVNGVVAASAEPEELARAILRVHEGGRALRESHVRAGSPRTRGG